MLGEHSRELLREYGYSDDEIDAFAAEGVIEEARLALALCRNRLPRLPDCAVSHGLPAQPD
jgi:hypothetical protein